MIKNQILFTPIDLPPLRLDPEKLKRFRFQQESENSFGERFFRTVFLRGATGTKTKPIYHLYDETLNWEWNKTAREHFPEVIEAVSLLPFKKINVVTFVGAKNNKPIPPHYDFPLHQVPEYAIRNEPCSYRISIGDVNDAFFVSTTQGSNDQEIDEGRYLFGNMPANHTHWCMSATKAFHSTLPREDKETLFISGLLDDDAHDLLIARSYEKYKEYAITAESLMLSGRPLRELIKQPWSDLKDKHPELYDVTKGR